MFGLFLQILEAFSGGQGGGFLEKSPPVEISRDMV
jgi:hypothetical protein